MSIRKRVYPKPHRLTIGRQYYEYARRPDGERIRPRTVPVLRFGGDWLQRAGFDIGQRVQVCVSAGRIVIVPAPVGLDAAR